MIEVDPYTWFGARQLEIVPAHFIKSSMISITPENYLWVLSKLSGRFSVITQDADIENYGIYFEDPKDAMMFELRWGGN